MKYLQTIAKVSALLVALVIGTTVNASANSLLSRIHMGGGENLDAISDAGHDIILVDRGERRQNRARNNAKTRNLYGRKNRRLRRHSPPRVKQHRRAKRRTYSHKRKRHSRRRHRSSGVYIGLYPYYDPFYNHGYYRYPSYDYGYYGYPNYDAPTYYSPPPVDRRLSCTRVRNKLRRKGYHRVRVYECKGKVYVFYARAGGKNYRIRVNAYSGRIKSRRRL